MCTHIYVEFGLFSVGLIDVHGMRSMVVDDFYIVGAELGPSEADAPFDVDTDAVGPLAFTSERFEVIRRGVAEIEEIGRVEDPREVDGGSFMQLLGQFPHGLTVGEPFGEVVFES